MRWQGGRRSGNVQDRRGRGAMIGGAGGLVVLVVALLLGVNPGDLMQAAGPATQPAATGAPEDELGQFVDVVLGTTEDSWNARFAEAGRRYEEPTLVLFSGAVESACGYAQAAVGPFYCPADRHIYIDLSFYADLRDRLGAGGDFAQAYVIAHEVGHHVQTLLGVSDDVRSRQARASEAESNELQVRMELQADCLAGIWAHDVARAGLLETGDVDEALGAAAAIGDDRLQMQSRGYVVPESFTHGTSEQRARSFRTGLDSGLVERCETFGS